MVQSVQWLDGFHTACEGRNGGGDPWHTDGRLAIVSLRLSGRCLPERHGLIANRAPNPCAYLAEELASARRGAAPAALSRHWAARSPDH